LNKARKILKYLSIVLTVAFTLCIGIVYAASDNAAFNFNIEIENNYNGRAWWVRPAPGSGLDYFYQIGSEQQIQDGLSFSEDWAHGAFTVEFKNSPADTVNIVFGFINNTAFNLENARLTHGYAELDDEYGTFDCCLTKTLPGIPPYGIIAPLPPDGRVYAVWEIAAAAFGTPLDLQFELGFDVYDALRGETVQTFSLTFVFKEHRGTE